MSSIKTQLTTGNWSRLVVPAVGRAYGHVCPKDAAFAGQPMRTLAHATGHPAWSPPIT